MPTRTSVPKSPRERLLFNDGWRFFRGDAPDAGEALDYARLRPWLLATGAELVNEGVSKPVRLPGHPGAKVSFVRPEFDDSGWRALDLPHDWGIEGPFLQELPGETGKLAWHGAGWYRKRFRLPKSDAGRRIALDVDGAMAFSAIWLNGYFVGGWPYGYSSFRVDLDPYVELEAENVLAIRLHNPETSSRWYPGSGLYRNVWLVKTDPVRVAHWGSFVSTPRIGKRSAIVNVDLTLENTSDEEADVVVSTALHALDAAGAPLRALLGRADSEPLRLSPRTQALRTHTIEILRPKLWSLEARHRYLAVTTIQREKAVIDRIETPFGVRSVKVDADEGFLLNGKRARLNGVCMHHDLGALGTAINRRALERQIEILQAMGANAIRTSHNPPAPELLELCDRMGMLVIVEAFDCWRRGKKWPQTEQERGATTYFDYARVFDDWHERDLRAMVRRDRNHPSVVAWSIGNEVIEQWYSDGWKLAQRLSGIVREEDRTRPVTAAFNGEIAGYTGFQTALDLFGYNYKPSEYGRLHEKNPTLPVFGSETASTVSSRGEYFFPVSDDPSHGQVDFQVSSYDLSTPPWGVLPDHEFRGLDRFPFTAGEFVWTGFDYLGEPTPYNADSTNLLNFSNPADRERLARELERIGRLPVPSRSSYFGIVDLAGFPKDRFFLYQARWRPELRMAHILPHWNWPERSGELTPVHVYSSGDEAELFLNGRSLGVRRKKRFEYRFRWDGVVYEPGELRVRVKKRGKQWASAVRRTTGPATKLTLTADRNKLAADGSDLGFVTARITDAQGLVVPRANHRLVFSIHGPGLLVALDNGDATSHEPFQGTERNAFNGLALAVVRTTRRAGKIRLRVESQDLAPGEVSIETRARSSPGYTA